jgi:Imelysin
MVRERMSGSAVLAASIVVAGLCGVSTSAAAPRAAGQSAADLSGIKVYLVGRSQTLVREVSTEHSGAERYYALAKASGFDYAKLWRNHRAEVSRFLIASKASFNRSHKAYEEEEGIVAGVPSLARYDVIIDSGTSASDDPKTAVPFSLTLPDGRVLRQPGNLFHALLEPTLWGTDPRFVAKPAPKVDLDGDGTVEFGEVMPDANVLVAITRSFERFARESDTKARAWKPTSSDVLTALVVMVPTMEGYFGEWKSSRFILGNKAQENAFVAHSRLIDVHGILLSLRNIYSGVKPLVASASPAQANQIGAQLNALSAFVDGIYAKEKAGKKFKPNEADLLGSQAQRQANAIAGEVSQVAGALGITLQA